MARRSKRSLLGALRAAVETEEELRWQMAQASDAPDRMKRDDLMACEWELVSKRQRLNAPYRKMSKSNSYWLWRSGR